MNLSFERQMAMSKGEPVTLDPDFDAGPRTVEEMNLLEDEADEMISRKEFHALSAGTRHPTEAG